jgi:hypothetical protein
MNETCNNPMKFLGIRVPAGTGERGSVEGERITGVGDSSGVGTPKAISRPSPDGLRSGSSPSAREGYNGISGLYLWLGWACKRAEELELESAADEAGDRGSGTLHGEGGASTNSTPATPCVGSGAPGSGCDDCQCARSLGVALPGYVRFPIGLCAPPLPARRRHPEFRAGEGTVSPPSDIPKPVGAAELEASKSTGAHGRRGDAPIPLRLVRISCVRR